MYDYMKTAEKRWDICQKRRAWFFNRYGTMCTMEEILLDESPPLEVWTFASDTMDADAQEAIPCYSGSAKFQPTVDVVDAVPMKLEPRNPTTAVD